MNRFQFTMSLHANTDRNRVPTNCLAICAVHLLVPERVSENLTSKPSELEYRTEIKETAPFVLDRKTA